MSNSSLSSFFSASPGTSDSTASFSGRSLITGSSVDFSDSSASDTIRNSATMTTIPSFDTMPEILLTSSAASSLSNLLSISLSLDTIGSLQSRASIVAVPPCPTRADRTKVQTLVDLDSSPFIRRSRFTVIFPDEHEPTPVITTPTPARLRSLMKEKLFIGGWINQVDGGYIPEHIPWEYEEDMFAPMPWVPEGSLVSKNRFHEVRQGQRPKSYSPPPTPPAGHDVPPLDALPFPAIIPSSEGSALRRAASFHPGGSQRLRREALVIDGKVTIDTGFKLRSRSCESIVPSPSEPNNVDLVVRQLNDDHQSGLERLKNSILRLMKMQSERRYSTATKAEKHSKVPFSTALPNETKDKVAQGSSQETLAVRRGLPVPSALKLASTCSLSPVSPYHPDIPTPFRGSPSAATPLFEVVGFSLAPTPSKRQSIGIEDMCTSLRSLVSPVTSKFIGEEGITSSQGCCPGTDPLSASDDAVNEILRTPIGDWNFASELEGIYGGDPFSYFDVQERMPSFIRPSSIVPDVVTENTETQRYSGLSATSISTFPKPPVDTLTVPLIPYITVSGGGPAAERSKAETRSPFPSLGTASDESLVDSGDSDEIGACIVVNSAETSPRSSEDRDVPLAIRRLTLLGRSSAAIPKVGDFSSVGKLRSNPSSCGIPLVQGAPKPATKIVRFAPETEERAYLADLADPYSPSNQRPRSSSVPSPRRGSLKDKAFFQRDECKDRRLSSSQPIAFPSKIPKKRTFTRISQSGRHTIASQRNTGAPSPGKRNDSTPAELEHVEVGRKRQPSLIPVPGLKASLAVSSLERGSADSGEQATGLTSRLYVSLKHPSRTPTPQSALTQQKTPLATSWSMTLRQYVRGGDASSEKRKVSHSPSPRSHREATYLPASPIGTKDDRKSSLPVKKASFLRDGAKRVTPVGVHGRTEARGGGIGGDDHVEGKVIGSVDKTGGIGYIAPPKVRAASQPRGRVKGETQGYSTVGAKTLRPGQIRNLLGRLAA